MKNFSALLLAAGLALAGARAETVSALGRLVPAGGVIDVVAFGGDLVEAVLVREGQWVEAGTPLARVRGLALAQARLAQIEAETAAQLATAASDLALARERLAATEAEDAILAARLKRIVDVKDNAVIAPDKIEERQLARGESALRLAVARDAVERARRVEEVAHRTAAARLAEARLPVVERELRAP
ncbi:MAG: hypothetical protein RLZZ15_802, partial [Verrucomicrobiota bacterium]